MDKPMDTTAGIPTRINWSVMPPKPSFSLPCADWQDEITTSGGLFAGTQLSVSANFFPETFCVFILMLSSIIKKPRWLFSSK